MNPQLTDEQIRALIAELQERVWHLEQLLGVGQEQ